MSNLAFDPEPTPRPSARRPGPTAGPSWLVIFSACLVASLIASAITVFAVRAYLRWSIEDSMRRIDETPPKLGK